MEVRDVVFFALTGTAQDLSTTSVENAIAVCVLTCIKHAVAISILCVECAARPLAEIEAWGDQLESV